MCAFDICKSHTHTDTYTHTEIDIHAHGYLASTYLSHFVSLFCICSCDTRYVGDYCEHRNPCLTGHGRCQNGGTCQVAFRNGRPGISCLCPLGFEESLCEIAVANACDQARCYNGGTCQLKTLQDYSCICANGYTGKLQTHTHTHRKQTRSSTNQIYQSILLHHPQAITARHRIYAPAHHAATGAPAPL